MVSIEPSRQRYLNLIHRYLQGRLDYLPFRKQLQWQWAEEREALWHGVWQAARVQHCLEQAQLAKGEVSLAPPSDPRRFPRMLDRLCNLCIRAHSEEAFRASVQDLLAAYRNPDAASPEARYIQYPPRVAVFERPLPPNSSHRYPCTVEDICAQLARVPEYDLEGLWTIGLAPLVRKDDYAHGIYYRRKYPMRKPVILLHSFQYTRNFWLGKRTDPGYIEQHWHVECSYGMQMERRGKEVLCRWSAENYRRYIVEHVLLHEIGHHVLYQQRWRARQSRELPSHIHEQFAEDYAIRFQREEKRRNRQ